MSATPNALLLTRAEKELEQFGADTPVDTLIQVSEVIKLHREMRVSASAEEEVGRAEAILERARELGCSW